MFSKNVKIMSLSNKLGISDERVRNVLKKSIFLLLKNHLFEPTQKVGNP